MSTGDTRQEAVIASPSATVGLSARDAAAAAPSPIRERCREGIGEPPNSTDAHPTDRPAPTTVCAAVIMVAGLVRRRRCALARGGLRALAQKRCVLCATKASADLLEVVKPLARRAGAMQAPHLQQRDRGARRPRVQHENLRPATRHHGIPACSLLAERNDSWLFHAPRPASWPSNRDPCPHCVPWDRSMLPASSRWPLGVG